MSDAPHDLNPTSPERPVDVPEHLAQAEMAPAEAADADVLARELSRVDTALARIEAGEYGNCTGCGARLDDALLAADPTAEVCPAHLELDHPNGSSTVAEPLG